MLSPNEYIADGISMVLFCLPIIFFEKIQARPRIKKGYGNLEHNIEVMKEHGSKPELFIAGCLFVHEILDEEVDNESKEEMIKRKNEVMTNMINKGMGEALVDGMKIHEDDPEVLIHGFEALENLYFCEDDDIKTPDLFDCCEFVLNVIKKYESNEIVSLRACAAINNFIIDDAKLEKLTELGLIDVLLQVIKAHEMFERIHDFVFLTFFAYSRDKKKIELLIQKGVVEVVIGAMNRFNHNLILQQIGCSIFWELANVDESHDRLISLGVVEVVMRTLNENQTYIGVLKSGLGAIQSITCNAEMVPTLMKKGLLNLILDMMKKNKENGVVQDLCCQILWDLTSDFDNKSEFINAGVVESIYVAMSDFKKFPTILHHSLCALEPLAIDEGGRIIILKTGIDELVLDGMVRFKQNVTIQLLGCEFLLILLENACHARMFKDLNKLREVARMTLSLSLISKEWNSEKKLALKTIATLLVTKITMHESFRVPPPLKIKMKGCELLDKIGDCKTSNTYKIRMDVKEGEDIFAYKQFHISGFTVSGEEKRMIEFDLLKLQNLRHSHIVRVIGVVGNPNAIDMHKKALKVGVVMEYCENGSFRCLLDRNPCIELDLIIRLLIGAAQGLEYLHAHEKVAIVHGNIKSDNILIDLYFNAKLSDYCITKFKKSISGDNEEAQIFANISAAYKAPEAFDGKLDATSDIYSFGCVVLEMLTGERPWSGKSQAEIRKIVVEDKVSHDLSKLRNDCPKSLIDLMSSCLNYEKQKRPSIKEIRVVLEAMKVKKND